MKIDPSKIVRYGCLGVSGLILVACLLSTSFENESQKQMRIEKQEQLVQVESDYNDLVSQVESLKESSGGGAETLVNSAKKTGEHVADIANQIGAAYVEINSVEDSQKRSELIDDMLATLSPEMDKYFGEGTDFRTAWYSTLDTELMKSISWSFVTNYNFGTDSTKVLWLCRNTKDQILAYVTATYYADTDTFDGAVKRVTTLGGSLMQPTPGTGEDPQGSVDPNADSVTGLLDAAGLTDEEQQQYEDQMSSEGAWDDVNDQHEAMDALREQMTGGDGA